MLVLLLACAAPPADSAARAECSPRAALPMGCGDLDCDGSADLAFAQTENAAGAYDATSSVWWGSGFEAGAAGLLPTLGAVDVAAADLDGDDWPDLVFADVSDGQLRTVDSYVYWGGSAGFAVGRRAALPTVGVGDVEIADVDGDGWLDLVFANRYDGGSAASEDSYRVDVYVYLGGPDGYSVERRIDVPGFGAAQTAVGDFDQDGTMDLALAAGTFWTDASWVYFGGPDGWSVDTRIELPTYAPEGVVARDLDADGWLDLVYANFYDALDLDIDSTVYWGGPDGFDPAVATAVPTHGADDVISADLGGDGCEELVIANAMEGNFAELGFEARSAVWAFGPGVREPTLMHELPTVSAAAVAAGDVDADGVTDLVFANRYDVAGEAAPAVSYVYLGPDFTVRRDLGVAAAAGVALVGGQVGGR
ncbi:MAG: VCBS repeat-containing protein [Pseudomonadota bacterium]|nr:VCBS repeat-containing protein [Pseudomonadota bacterium]